MKLQYGKVNMLFMSFFIINMNDTRIIFLYIKNIFMIHLYLLYIIINKPKHKNDLSD